MASHHPGPAARQRRSARALRMDNEHAPLVAEFLRVVWNPQTTAELVLQGRAAAAERNVVEPGIPPPSFIFLLDERVIGYVATLPMRLWHGGRVRGAYWLNGLMVLPEFRNGPIGYQLLQEAVRQLPLAAALSVAAPARRLFEAIGFADRGVLSNFVGVVRPLTFLRRLDLVALGPQSLPAWVPQAFNMARAAGLTPLMAGGLRAVTGTYRWFRGGATRHVGPATMEQQEVDSLWATASAGIDAAPVRDWAALTSRYGRTTNAAEDMYQFVEVREGSALRALAVVRRPSDVGDARLKGIRVSTLSDLLWYPGDEDSALAAVRGAESAALGLGADALLCSASLGELTEVMRRSGYLRVGGNLHFFIRDHDNSVGLPEFRSWHLMRGDAHADEVF